MLYRVRHFAITVLTLCCTAVSAQALSILTEDDPPYNYLNAGNQPAGMGVEIVQEIQRRLGNRDPITFYPWARAYHMARTEPNVVLFMMARTAERNEQFHWVGPVIDNSWQLVARADSPLQLGSLDDARRLKSIGVYRDDSRDLFLTQKGFANLSRSQTTVTGVKMLMAGRVDALAAVDTTLAQMLREAGHSEKEAKVLLTFSTVQVYIALSKTTEQDIADRWQAAFAAMVKDGSYRKIFTKYFPAKKLPGPAITTF